MSETPDFRYVREGPLGAGGMGTVSAVRDQALGRTVALKELHPDASADTATRLAQEARMTAGLDHPGIVTVHDTGIDEDGRPWYTMRLVRGLSLAERVANTPKGLTLVRHVLDAAQAVAWAHSQFIVHRDLKPANVMIGEMGETQVVDWGLAAPVGSAVGMAGTPQYMSPEQAAGEAVDLRDDVWSLGAILYELVAGAPLRPAGSAAEVLRRAHLPAPPLPASAPPELAAIVRKALALRPRDRYPSAKELAADLASWLDGRPVLAHRYTPRELLGRTLREYRLPLLVGAVALVALFGVLAVTTWRTMLERDRAVTAEQAATDSLALALAGHARAAFAAGAWAEAEVLASRALVLHEDPDARGVLCGVAARRAPALEEDLPAPRCIKAVLGRDPDTVLCEAAGEVSGWTLRPLTKRWTVRGVQNPIVATDGSIVTERQADAHYVVLEPATGAVRVAVPWAGIARAATARWVLGERARLVPLDGASSEALPRCEGNPNTTAITDELVITGCDAGEIVIHTVGGATERFTVPDGWVPASPAQWVPERHQLLTVGAAGRLELIGPASRRSLGKLELGTVIGVFTGPHDRAAAVGTVAGVELWDLEAGAAIARLPQNSSRDVRLLPGGDVVELGERWRRWSVPEAVAATVLPGGGSAVAITADGAEVTTGDGSGYVRRWSTATGRPIDAWTGQALAVKSIVYGPRAELWANLGLVGRMLDEPMAAARRLSPQMFLRRIETFATGSVVAVASGSELFLFDENGELTRVDPDVGPPVDLGASPHQRQLVVTGDRTRLLSPGAPLTLGPILPALDDTSGTVNDAGTRIYTGGTNGIRAWSPPDTLLWTTPFPGPYPYELRLSGDERRVVAAGLDGATRVYDTASGKLTATLRGHTARLGGLALAVDRPLLATTSWDGTTRLWDLSALDLDPAAAEAAALARWHMTPEAALAAVGR